MNEKKCEIDGTIRVPNWELVGQEVYIVVNNDITKQKLNRIEINKVFTMDGHVKTNVTYHCGANKKEKVYRTREACAGAWLEAQGITVGLKDEK